MVCYEKKSIPTLWRTDMESHRERLRRFAGSQSVWEQELGEGLVLAGSRVPRRRQGTANRPFLIWFVDGGKKLRDGAGVRCFAPGDLLVLPPTVAFASEERPDEGGEFLAVRLEVELELLSHLGRVEPSVAAALARPRTPQAANHAHKPPVSADLLDALERCVDYTARGARSRAMARRRFEDVVITLAEAAPAAAAALVRGPDVLGQLDRLMRTAPHAPWTLGEAAAALAMSPATLKRRLARHELTFSAVRQTVRVEEGRRLLVHHGQTVLQAALNVGYASPSKFAAAYRRRFGSPPGRDKIG